MDVIERALQDKINIARLTPQELRIIDIDPRGLSHKLAEKVEQLAEYRDEGVIVPENTTVGMIMKAWDVPITVEDRQRLDTIGINMKRIDDQRETDLENPGVIFSFTP